MRGVVALLLAASVATGAAQVQYFRFDIDQDKLSGAVDHSWLNRPLTASSKIVVRDGRFHTVGGERVRLYGVNLAFGANFPTAQDAKRIALRLRKLGVNLVRLHHMDSSPDSNVNNAGSTLTTGPYPTLNTVSIARLRTFLDELKANGIYADLNLKVGYTFRPSIDGVPALPGGAAIPTQSKPLHMIDARMIDLQCDYTRKLIDALKLHDDPVLAVVEINNESSLVYDYQINALEPYLVGEFGTQFQSEWNRFLARKYTSTAALRTAWGGDDTGGPNVLGSTWTIEIHSPAQATLSTGAEGPVVRVSKGGGWVFLKQVGFSVSMGRPYLAEVEIRADLANGQSRAVNWDIKQDVSPWNTMTSKAITVTNQWQKFTMPVTPAFNMDGVGRFALDVENVEAPFYLRNAKLSQARRRGLDPAESIEAANIAMPNSSELSTDARTNDYLLFLADRDKYYLERMMEAAHEKLDSTVPVTGSQMGFGGLLNLDSHATMDYLDNHYYVDHYSFPNTSWDGRDWRFRDQSSVATQMTNFASMAIARDPSKPYTVSEFNQPWPNTYAAECDPTLAAFGAFQDWDSIMHFAYSHSHDWDNGVPNGFNLNGDWTKFPGFAQSAFLFRSGAIRAGRQMVEIPVSLDNRLRFTREKRNGGIGTFLNTINGYDAWLAFVHPVGITTKTDTPVPTLATRKPTAPYLADTGDFTFNPTQKLFLIHSSHAAGVIGFTGTRRTTAGAIDVELAASARGYVSLLVTPLDGQPIVDSRRLLISNPGYTLRTQPNSGPARPQEIRLYPGTTDWYTLEPDQSKPSGDLNGGQKPVWMERVEARLTLRTAASAIAVYPLNGDGTRRDKLTEADLKRVDGGFEIHLASDAHAPSAWYEVVVEQARGALPDRRMR